MPWNNKQKRAFQRVISGMQMAEIQNRRIRFMTLTSSNVAYDSLNDDFRVLKARIKRLTPAKLLRDGYISSRQLHNLYLNKPLNEPLIFEYFKVQTNEGNGVLHIVYKGDYIPQVWLSENWMDIHNAWDVNIKEIKYDIKRTAMYVISQYVSNQDASFVRSSWSQGWCFHGFVAKWKWLKQWFSGDQLYDNWRRILREQAYPQSTLDDFG